MTPGEMIGPYRLVARIAHGAMGEVWDAEAVEAPDANLPTGIRAGDNVALKAIPEYLSGDSALVGRLRREAEAIRKVEHPGVVKLFEVCEFDERVYLVMERLRGETLAERLTRDHQLPIPELERVARLLADALAATHAAGVIHRDLKPLNVFMTEDGGVKLIDLGVAKVIDEVSLTMTGSHFGTPAYMAPEAFLDAKRVGPAADVWSLGVMLYEASAGRLPYPGASAATIIARIMDTNVTPKAPLLVRSDLPPKFAALIDLCLVRDPARRLKDGADVSTVLSGGRPQRSKLGLSTAQYLPVIIAIIVVLGTIAAVLFFWSRSPSSDSNQPTASDSSATDTQAGETANLPPIPPDGVITGFEDGWRDNGTTILNKMGGITMALGKADAFTFTGATGEGSLMYARNTVLNFDTRNVHSGEASFRVVWGRNSSEVTWAVFGFDMGPAFASPDTPRRYFASKDISGFRFLSLWVKGSKGGEKFRVQFRDKHAKGYEAQVFYPQGTANLSDRNWNEIRVPIAELIGIDLKSVEYIGLELNANLPGEGVIYVDDIKLER